MPHVIVKLWPGKTEAQKQRLSDTIVQDFKTILGSGDESISVAFEEIPPEDWSTCVYEPDIQAKWQSLTKIPGYGPGPHRELKGR